MSKELKNSGAGVIGANGGKCPDGVKFQKYGNPHGEGMPLGYDDTLAGVDGDISATMKDIKKAYKPRRP